MEKNETIVKITGLQHEMAKTMRRHAFKHWVGLNLSTSQVKALFCIAENERISSKKLAEKLDVTPANVTGIIDRLIEQKLVRRLENPQDRRFVFLETTQDGNKLIENLEQHVSEKSARLLSEMSQPDLEHLYLGLLALLRVVRSQVRDDTPS